MATEKNAGARCEVEGLEEPGSRTNRPCAFLKVNKSLCSLGVGPVSHGPPTLLVLYEVQRSFVGLVNGSPGIVREIRHSVEVAKIWTSPT